MKPRTVSLSKRGVDFETIMWAFVRLSALAMYLLALIAIVGALIMGARTQMNMADLIRWTFMPNANHVLSTDVPDIAPWTTLFWKLTASAFVLFASAHGLHGLLVVIEDYLSLVWLRRVLRIVVILLWLPLSAVGIYLIFNV
jgi:succinate dehydrogenase hydrophobic anchor subunit